MLIKLKLVEILIVSISLILGGMCLGVYLEAGMENGLLYAFGLFLISIVVLYNSRIRRRKKKW